MIKLFHNEKERSFYMTQDEFLNKANVWVEKDKKTWTHITLLAYFCLRYREKHGVNFRFARWNGAPAKTKESRDFSKLIKEFLPDDYVSLNKDNKSDAKISAMSKAYNYINWMFDYKFRMKNEGVTGTGIFLNHNILNQFERMWFLHQKKNKDQSNLDEFKLWIKDNHPDFSDNYDFQDHKDLEIVIEFIKSNSFKEGTSECAVLKKFNQLKNK